MKHPKSVDAYRIADTFQFLATARMGHVDIEEFRVPAVEHICGSSACHGGWFQVAAAPVRNPQARGFGALEYQAITSYSDGAELMARELGMGNMRILEEWAHHNPNIWGNKNGGDMFTGDRAFTKGPPPTLGKIARHWYGVGARLEQLEKKHV